jgi:hypothetical protein
LDASSFSSFLIFHYYSPFSVLFTAPEAPSGLKHLLTPREKDTEGSSKNDFCYCSYSSLQSLQSLFGASSSLLPLLSALVICGHAHNRCASNEPTAPSASSRDITPAK